MSDRPIPPRSTPTAGGDVTINPPSPIDIKYASLGRAVGFLGNPVSGEARAQDGMELLRHYQDGSIYWFPETGAHEVHGEIEWGFNSLNGPSPVVYVLPGAKLFVRILIETSTQIHSSKRRESYE